MTINVLDPFAGAGVVKGVSTGKSLKELREFKNQLATDMQKHLDANENDWKDEHEAQHGSYVSAMQDVTKQIRRRESLDVPSFGSDANDQSASYVTMIDGAGKRHFAVTKEQKFANVPFVGGSRPRDCRYAAGEYLRAMVTGVTSSTPPSIGAALSRGNATSAGYLLPPQFSADVIDLARSKSVIMEAGAITIALTGADFSIGRLLNDPEVKPKAENAKFHESEITLGRTTITPRLIGCIVTASREMIEDAPNAAELIQLSMASALANSLDRFGVHGLGTGEEPMGLMNYPDVASTSDSDPISYINVAGAAMAVRVNNHEPMAAILNTIDDHVLGMTTDSQGRWLGPPPPLENVMRLESTHVPQNSFVVGDFTKFAWGIREGATVEIGETSEAFERHQVCFKIFFRGDTALIDSTAFHKVTTNAE